MFLEHKSYLTPDMLSSFKQHGLDDLNAAKLMDRVDSKFLLPTDSLPRLLDLLKPLCSLLNIKGHLLARYHNIYYDTAALQFYHQHHNGKLNRMKVRRRCYTDHDLAFFELKIKNNRSRTVKTRTKIDKQDETTQFESFVSQPSLSNIDTLKAVQECSYERISLASEDTGERITIDLNTHFVDLNNAHHITLKNVCIVELKQQKLNQSSPLYRVIKHMGLRPSSFSKYCLGTALLRPNDIKSNLFKPTIMALQKRHGVVNEPHA